MEPPRPRPSRQHGPGAGQSGRLAHDLRLKALALQRQQLVASHVSQLRAAMGAARFQQLDSFVRVSSTVRGAAAAQVAK